jgi:hypothetical protein
MRSHFLIKITMAARIACQSRKAVFIGPFGKPTTG